MAELTCVKNRGHNCGMKYGYARTSPGDQTTAPQLAALKRARCARIFEDRGLSASSLKRPALSRCLKTLRPGDTLIVWRLDRPGRSLRDLITMLDDLRARGVKFHSLTEGIDTATPAGRKVKLTPEQIDHARKLIDKGEARQHVADLLNVGRSTLYRALRS